jgi:glycosyltransferase involved in cell wall biosynthesis
MGPQDGLDWLLDAIEILVRHIGRTDCQFTLMGTGDCLDGLRATAARRGLDEWVTFTGWTEDDVVFDHLATADIGLSPDPMNRFNDFSTMNKTLEYMAFGLPIVAFDLGETRFSAGDAGVYATPGDAADYARWIDRLLADPGRRAAMGEAGRKRIQDELAWDLQVPAYIALYDELLGRVVRVDAGVGGNRSENRTVVLDEGQVSLGGGSALGSPPSS